MEDWRIKFPKVSDIDVAFGGYPEDWFAEMLKTEAEKDDRLWESMASNLFFCGGTISVNKELPEEYRREGLQMLRSVLGSFTPKHEHKERVCGLILKSICK